MFKKIDLLLDKVLNKYLILLIIVLSMPAVLALFHHGFYGASDDLHIGWLYEMDRTISLGQFPPRFVPDLSFGYGYPLFDFVFPLPFYIGEIFHKFGLSLVDSVKSVFLISIPISMYFMYKFLKEHASSVLVALSGAVLYVYTPYRSTDIYVRGAIGEIFAFIFPPLIAYAITKISSDKNKRWIALLGLASAGLILSHDIMAYMFMPFLFIFAILQRRNFIRMCYGFALGLFSSAYFWLPALIESKLMKYDTVFNFTDHFPTLIQLVKPYFGYGASVPGPYDGMSFFVGSVNILLFVIAIILYKRIKPITFWSMFMISVSVFMMNFRSTFMWNIIPLVPYFQFPWRFLSLTTFATSILVLIFNEFKYSKIIALIIILFSIGLNFTYFKPQDFLGREDFYFLNRYIPFPVASSEYLKTGEEYLRLPLSLSARPKKVSVNPGLNQSFTVNYEKETTFEFQKYYFPGWMAKVDGKLVKIVPGAPYGQITFNVPAGEHRIEVYFQETQLRTILDAISMLTIVFVIYLLI